MKGEAMKKIDRIPDTGQQWYKDAKYGLFIHWGLYAILAGEYKGQKTDHISEWIMNTLNIPVEEYEKLAGEFCSQQFCADELVRMANLRGGFHGNGGTAAGAAQAGLLLRMSGNRRRMAGF